jgi:hypothetical protein
MSTIRFRIFLSVVAYYTIVFSFTWYSGVYSLRPPGNWGLCFFIPTGACAGPGGVWLPPFWPVLTWIGILCIAFLVIDHWRNRGQSVS